MSEFQYAIVKNPEIFQENRLPAHSDHDFFAVQDGQEESCRVSLNGIWKFHYAKNYALAPQGFEKPEYDVRAWDEIRVPGHIQMQGYDHPMYVNTQYPWDGHEEIVPGEIPTRFNPTGSYVTFFEVPRFMKGREIHVSFQGVESGFALWVNGHYVGYSEDSFTPSEFDLTEYLTEGENRMAVQVFKWTGGSWCEDQDFMRFSGIFRNVWLVSYPEIHGRDLRIETKLEADYQRAELAISLQASGRGQISLTLKDGEETAASASFGLSKGKNAYKLSVEKPMLWSAEKPNLYELELVLSDDKGVEKEVIREKVGFREFKIQDSIMYLNGKRILFHGVNRHEFSADKGRAISEREILQDLLTMKKNNINAVRTSHYPNQTALYRLCDELGLYVIDETNLETHGMWEKAFRENDIELAVPGNRPEYLELIVDRGRSMFERDKNHPSILIWSLGNESLGGSDLYEMAEHFRKWDRSRPVHYEGTHHDRRFNKTSDIESTMYVPADEIREYLKEHRDKPYINCEYVHTMGNSCGAMMKYMALCDEEPLYQGGFIWDYIDQSITMQDRYGQEFQAYGGDFGERPCDYSFSGNGIVYGKDRDPSPKMQEVKYCYQNISVTLERAEDGSLTAEIFNRNLFTNTDVYDCVVTVEKEGRYLTSQEGAISVEPESKRRIRLDIEIPEEAGEYAVTMSFHLKEDEVWAEKGHEVAFGQLVFRQEGKEETGTPTGKTLEISRGTVNIGVRGDNFEVLFSTLHGGLISYKYGGKELMASIPKPNFWRALTENDMANQFAFRGGQWKAASMYLSHKYEHGRKESSYRIEEKENSLVVSYTYHLPVKPALDCQLRYEVFPDGTVDTKLELPASDAVGEIPAFEMLFTLDAAYENLSWYGYGPEETYLDRFHTKLGIYENQVKDNLAKYLVPQECGNKAGVRWARVTDAQGSGLVFSVLPQEEGYNGASAGVQIPTTGLQFSAMPYAPQELENAKHPTELPPVHYTTVRIGEQMGVGGDDTWGAEVHPEFRLDNTKDMKIHFRFKGV